ncbi:TetR/AcrR family transcriptional regulator [Aeromicrobium sp. NPDC092404]|uniref:TetR/AcrR family transcriptional regulator n=1 Tax=Aeromicrobium sp. NPDC092404 TaxID=3154976 RepID=UPI003443CCC6
MDAARKVFDRDGFFDARIADIADMAGVAHGSFYTYFEGKEQIFRAVAEQVAEEILAQSQPPEDAPQDPLARIELTNRAYLASQGRNRRFFDTLNQVATFSDELSQLRRDLRRHFVDRAVAGIRHGQAAGVFDASLDAEATGNALCAMVEHMSYLVAVLGEPLEEARVLDTMSLIWARTLGLTDASSSL